MFRFKLFIMIFRFWRLLGCWLELGYKLFNYFDVFCFWYILVSLSTMKLFRRPVSLIYRVMMNS